MGFSTLIDILGSTIIGGLLLFILLQMNSTSVQNNYQYSGERIVQQNLVEIANQVEYDFRKIGYCNDYTKVPDPAIVILKADSSSISFLTDVVTTSQPFGDGILDTLKYYLGSTNELTVTPNPKDRILYRKVNNTSALGNNMGVTQFKLTYYDANGNLMTSMPSTPPLGIAAIQIDISVENPAAYGNDYSSDKKAIWRQFRLASRNFTLR